MPFNSTQFCLCSWKIHNDIISSLDDETLNLWCYCTAEVPNLQPLAAHSINRTPHISTIFVIDIVVVNSNTDLLLLPLFNSLLRTPKVLASATGGTRTPSWESLLYSILLFWELAGPTHAIWGPAFLRNWVCSPLQHFPSCFVRSQSERAGSSSTSAGK